MGKCDDHSVNSLRFTEDPATLKPEQLLDRINGFTRLRHARDLINILGAEGATGLNRNVDF